MTDLEQETGAGSSSGDAVAAGFEKGGAVDRAAVICTGRNVSEKRFSTKSQAEFQIDFQSLGESGYLTPSLMRGRLAEAYRILKRPILKVATEVAQEAWATRNVIAVTSAVPGEGKTFTTLNLAISIAMEQDFSVLVVDVDLFARSLSQRVGLEGYKGLTDVLESDRLDLADVIVKTTLDGLSVIPAGGNKSPSAELLSSERMRQLIRELASRYDDRVILLDTAPLLTTSQAAIVSDLVGQILVVVEEGKTPQQTVKDAVALIAPDKHVGLVLNKSFRWSPNDYGPQYGGI